MRALATGGLWLYGAANVLAGVADLVARRGLPVAVSLGLIGTGILLIGAGLLTLRRSSHALQAALVALVLALALAVFNERVLGFGHPTHHFARVAFTLLILWSVVKARAARPR